VSGKRAQRSTLNTQLRCENLGLFNAPAELLLRCALLEETEIGRQ